MATADRVNGLRNELPALPLLLAVVLGAAYEAAVAFQWISLGSLPGDGPPYEGWFLLPALVAILTGSVVSFVLAVQQRSNRFVALLGAAAAALVVARFHGFDPYYLPTLRRYSDEGPFSASWVYAVAIVALLSSVLCLKKPWVGFIVNVPAMLLCAFTATFVGVGH